MGLWFRSVYGNPHGRRIGGGGEFGPQMGADGGRWWQMLGNGAKFDHKKEQAIAALLSHRNLKEAARAVGIGTAPARPCGTRLPSDGQAMRLHGNRAENPTE